MPTPKKAEQVDELKERLDRCTVAVATGYQGMNAAQVTDLRRRLRDQGVEYRVVKNTLVLRAAQELGQASLADVLKGPTGLAFGYGDVTAVAKGLNTYIVTTRMPLEIFGGLMGGALLSAEQVNTLALLPPKEELISQLLGRLQAPITMFVTVLSAPIRGLAIALQRIVEQRGGTTAPEAGPDGDSVATAVLDAPADAPEDVDATTPEEPAEATDEEATAEAPEPPVAEAPGTPIAETPADTSDEPPVAADDPSDVDSTEASEEPTAAVDDAKQTE